MPVDQRRPLPAARGGGRAGGAGGRLDSRRRPTGSTGWERGRGSSSSGDSSRAVAGGRRTRSRSPRPRADDTLRLTAKAVGDFTRDLRTLPVGAGVVAEGPYGVFTSDARTREKTLLIAGGIGITPVRALLDELEGDVVVLYRVLKRSDVIFDEELARASVRVDVVAGDHDGEGRDLLSPEHLLELVPDIAERDVFVSGPPAMVNAIEKNVRSAGVPRRHVHSERFAL